jgi:AcrR family transcriptional regulator
MRSTLRRAEKNEHTRRLLLDAARAVFVERGYHGTSLDAVSERAGLTKGAVYSRFGSKAELFLALLDERIDQSLASIRTLVGSGTLDGDTAAITEYWDRILHTELDWTLLVLEFRVHAARHPELNRRYAAAHRRFLDGITETIDAGFTASGVIPDRPANELAALMLAVSGGSALERAADPTAVPPGDLRRMFRSVLASAVRNEGDT